MSQYHTKNPSKNPICYTATHNFRRAIAMLAWLLWWLWAEHSFQDF